MLDTKDQKEEKNKIKTKKQKTRDNASLNESLGYLYKYFFVVNIFVFILILYVSYSYILKPKYDSVISGEEIEAKRLEHVEKMSSFRDMMELKKLYENVALEDKEKINRIVSNENNKEDLFREMESIADKNKIKNIRNKDEFFEDIVKYTDKSFIDTLEVEALPGAELINFAKTTKKGDLFSKLEIVKTSFELVDIEYSDLMKILKIIEVNLRIMDVQRVDYNPEEKTAFIELLTYQLKK